ncbi:GNAT family N-acetyltransferase [Arthrobacter sp. K5]|uniref:GNAT family N-acetyltransferase n=1 Tax=Arthrobacter sp. K5 TaxID=2839623 RepID=A0AAU8EKP3_9MICC
MTCNDTLHAEVVSFDDPRAAHLRDALSTELLARYATDEFPHLSPAARSALAVPPEEFIATVLVLTEDGTAMGHAALRRLGGEFEVKRVIVLPEARGKGAASILMSALRSWQSKGRQAAYPPDWEQAARSRGSIPETRVHADSCLLAL